MSMQLVFRTAIFIVDGAAFPVFDHVLSDDLAQTSQAIGGRDIADRTVQPHLVSMLNVTSDSFLEPPLGGRTSHANALPLDRTVPSFELAVALRIVRTGADVSQVISANELLEIFGDELRTVVTDDSRRHAGMFFESPSDHDFDILFGHRLADFPVHDVAAEAIQNRDQKVKRPAEIQIADVGVPFLMDFSGLNVACSFLVGLDELAIQTPSGFENAIGGTGTDGDDVVVEHHKSQTSVSFERVAIVEVKDGLFLPFFEPPVSRDFSVMLVGFAIAFFPGVVLAGLQSGPAQQRFARQVGSLRPVIHVIDDRIANVVGDPDSFQRSPLAFFALTFSSINSAMTSFL